MLLPEEVLFVDEPSEAAQGAQAVILLTEWPDIVETDWEAIAARSGFPGSSATAGMPWSRTQCSSWDLTTPE